jgi:aflatoxin B1 aldehyde reductase
MQFVLGTLDFSDPEIVRTFRNRNRQGCPIYVDTAYYYGNTETERTLGQVLREVPGFVRLTCKANPWHANDFTNGRFGGLSRENLRHQLETSMKNLGVDKIDTFLLHAWDYDTPIEETLDECERLYRQDRFDRFGVSNFSLGQVHETIDLCDRLNLPLTVYQGMYNAACRKVQPVIDVMHDLPGGSFVAYNPLAGGLLTGKYSSVRSADAIDRTCRFKDNPVYQSIFWKDELLDFHEVLGKEDPVRDAFAWLMYHSALDESRDAIVIGASSAEQLEQTLNAIERASPLDPERLRAIDARAHAIAPATPDYWY